MGRYPSFDESSGWPLLIIVIGLPFSPTPDHELRGDLNVLPKRIELLHLPSKIRSPGNGHNGCMSPRSTTPDPKLILGCWEISLLVLP